MPMLQLYELILLSPCPSTGCALRRGALDQDGEMMGGTIALSTCLVEQRHGLVRTSGLDLLEEGLSTVTAFFRTLDYDLSDVIET